MVLEGVDWVVVVEVSEKEVVDWVVGVFEKVEAGLEGVDLVVAVGLVVAALEEVGLEVVGLVAGASVVVAEMKLPLQKPEHMVQVKSFYKKSIAL